MKQLFTLCCLVFFSTVICMEDSEAKKVIELQLSTWPLRRDLRILKNVITGTKNPILSKEQREALKCREGMVAQHLDNVLKQIDHIQQNTFNQNFSDHDKHINKANEYLKSAQQELEDYKSTVKEITKIDIDIQAKL